MKTIKTEDIKTIINASKGMFFNVKFVKKNGDKRSMTCRKSVTKHLKGGKSTIKGNTNLVGVWEPNVKSYRCFDITRVTALNALGHKFVVNNNK